MMKKIILLSLTFFSVLALSAQDRWYQYGFKVGTNFPINREYSYEGDYLSGLRNAEFDAFFRAGKYVFGEVGFGYTFFKGEYDLPKTDTSYIYSDEKVVTHHLRIPVKVVGNVPISRSVTFLPHVGVIYQPLVKVKDNNINFSKKNLTTQVVLFTTGFDFKFGPILLGVNYRYSFQRFFQNKDGKHPQYISICAGLQL